MGQVVDRRCGYGTYVVNILPLQEARSIFALSYVGNSYHGSDMVCGEGNEWQLMSRGLKWSVYPLRPKELPFTKRAANLGRTGSR